MSESAVATPKQFTLPFLSLSEKRKEPFSVDMEVAALFCLAETERGKGGGLIVKQLEERLEFISKIGYPLWAVPWNDSVLVFDGLNRSNYVVSYACIPDVKGFIDNLRRSARTRETHLAFLRDHINYFQILGPERSLLVGGLIRNAEFLSEFDVYRGEALSAGAQRAQVGLLAHTIDDSMLVAEIQELEHLLSSFKADVALLYRCMKFLNKVTNHYLKVIRGKIKTVKDDFAVRLKEEEETVAPKIGVLKDDYDARITDVARDFEKQRLPIQKEKVKLEKAKEHVYERIERCKMEARTHAEKEDKVGEKKWIEKSDSLKKELSVVENQLKQMEKSLKDLEERRSLELFKLRDELEARVKEARKNLLELEASRDAKVLIHKQEMEKLENQTKLISDLIGAAVKLRESDIASLGKLGIRKQLGLESNALYFVPFYVTCFAMERKKRYYVIPPSIVSTIGLTTKLKGALGKAKMKHLLLPRFKVVTSLMDTILLLVKENAAFEAEIKELGEKNNILSLCSVLGDVKTGLSYLKNEGWLTDKEYGGVNQKLASIGKENVA